MIKRQTIDLLAELVRTNFKLRYQNSVLGVLWVLIKPYSMFIVMYLVWTRLTSPEVANFPLYLITGIVLYTFFNELVILGQNSLLDKASIILKVNFSRQIAVISSLMTAIVNLFINFIFIFIIMLFSRVQFDLIKILYFLFVVVVIFMMGLAISLFSSILTVKFRDLKNIFELGIFLLYWATPIFYTLSGNFIGSGLSSIIRYNPLGILINQARFGLGIYGEFDPSIFIIFIVLLALSILGWRFFNIQVKKIAEFF